MTPLPVTMRPSHARYIPRSGELRSRRRAATALLLGTAGRPVAADGTMMTDLISFRLPAGPIGRLVNQLFLARYLTGLTEDRNRQIKAEAES